MDLSCSWMTPDRIPFMTVLLFQTFMRAIDRTLGKSVVLNYYLIKKKRKNLQLSPEAVLGWLFAVGNVWSSWKQSCANGIAFHKNICHRECPFLLWEHLFAWFLLCVGWEHWIQDTPGCSGILQNKSACLWNLKEILLCIQGCKVWYSTAVIWKKNRVIKIGNNSSIKWQIKL